MNIFSDHDVYGQTVKFLRSIAHVVTRAQDVGLANAEDSEILQYAADKNLILVTQDKGCGALVFQKQATSRGVIFLRIRPSNIPSVHNQLNRVFTELTEAEIRRSFIAVEAKQYRVRRIP